jgi:hypothetical protein
MTAMQNASKAIATSLLTSVLALSACYAQQDGAQLQPIAARLPAGRAFSPQELDQMLAPIALYPDALLSQVLMAATYPLEVVEAARWSRANPGLAGDGAVHAADGMSWDPSVKSLVAFPQVINMMDQKLEWTERLGDAFLAQQAQVTDTVQDLRQRAASAGNLRSNEQLVVEQSGPTYVVRQANPQVVYVPYYDPNVVYGAWAYPSYPPVYWVPPRYYDHIWPREGANFRFDNGISVSAGFFFGGFDWGHRSVGVINAHPYYYRGSVRNTTIVNITNTSINNTSTFNSNNSGVAGVAGIAAVNRGLGAWQHDPAHRLGVPYRDAAVRQQFAGGAAAFDPRRDFHYRALAAQEPAANGALPGRPVTDLQAVQAKALSSLPNLQGDAATTGRPGRFGALGSVPYGGQHVIQQRPSVPAPAVRTQSAPGNFIVQAPPPRPAPAPRPTAALQPPHFVPPAPAARQAPAPAQQRKGQRSDDHHG